MQADRPATASGHRANPSRRGFTLVEVLVVLALLSLLSAAVIPSFQGQLAKGRRLDGQQALRALAQRLERQYTERGTYLGATLGAGGLYPAESGAGHYALAITDLADHAYRIAARPQGAQAADPCATLVYNQWGESSVSGAAGLAVGQCW